MAETVPCDTCGNPTPMLGTKRCDGCREVEIRLSGYLRRGGPHAIEFVRKAIADHEREIATEAEQLVISLARVKLPGDPKVHTLRLATLLGVDLSKID